jgi:predicted dehydrogenase
LGLLKIGVVGTGSLGRHHVRILAEMPEAELVGIHDLNRQTAEALASQHGTRVFDSWKSLAEGCQAMVVAVPTESHGSLGGELLRRGLHVMVEKPITSSLAEADALLAAAGDRVLAVGHVEFYNPAVQELLASGAVARFVEVQRLGVFTRRSLDVDVVLDLMIHDLQILHALDPTPVKEIRATGIHVLSPRIDIANARIELESGCVANLTASRVSSEKVRKLRVFGQSSYSSVDYQTQELKRYRLVPRPGTEPEILAENPTVTSREPLRAELEAFVAACQGEAVPYVDGHQGRRALATALDVVAAIG